ncbi:hypothetical protein [Marinifilum caeruleilacunae]|uniref:Tail fiber domain-containing protein n=1 Tax=Marinifilum caeruleilacunae TaxID=2499076 RepID=A0ABX1WRK3_9BACT|nr:hypothetical protein [Marinifilum caeruleilacunae]NOU58710.1 hypothetical protein [Marinifilum caeruleilacunae]
MKTQKTLTQFLAIALLILSVNKLSAQRANDRDAKDDWTNHNSWSWTLDDDNNGNGAGFRWWKNGGNDLDDLMMRLDEDKNLYKYGNTFVQYKASQRIFKGLYFVSDNISPKTAMLGCNETTLYLSSDIARNEHPRNLIINSLGDLSLQSSSVTINATPECQVSINTDAKVEDAALTVGGAMYVGPKLNLTSSEKFSEDHITNYKLWVEDGIVTEDIAIVSVNTWRDDVFEEDYSLPSLAEVEGFIKEHKHLVGIPSAEEVYKEGYSMQELDVALLGKVEELTLYTIEQDKKIESQDLKIQELTERLHLLEKLLDKNK